MQNSVTTRTPSAAGMMSPSSSLSWVLVVLAMLGCLLPGAAPHDIDEPVFDPLEIPRLVSGEYHHVAIDSEEQDACAQFGLISDPTTGTEYYVDHSSLSAFNLEDSDYVQLEIKTKTNTSPFERSKLANVGAKHQLGVAHRLVHHKRAKTATTKADGRSGARSILFVRMNYANVAESACSETCIQNLAWSSTQNLNGLYTESSYGALSIPSSTGRIVTVTVSKSINVTACAEALTTISADASAAVSAAFGLSFSSYDLVTMYTPALCSIGIAYINGQYAFIKSAYLDTVAHEIGHNFGFQHAATDANNDNTADDEYGDMSSIMGYSGQGNRGFSAPNRIQQGWLSWSYVLNISSTVCSSTTYDVRALQSTPVAGSYTALTVPRSNGNLYYISFRNNAGYDSTLGSSYQNKVSVHHWKQTGFFTMLVSSLSAGSGVFLSTEQVFVYVNSIGTTSASVTVQTCLAATPTPTPYLGCTPQDETLKSCSYGYSGCGYTGCQDTTPAGDTCQRWDCWQTGTCVQTGGTLATIQAYWSYYVTNFNLGAHNFCRNMNNDATIWCYTTNPNVRYAYCVPKAVASPSISPTISVTGSVTPSPVSATPSVSPSRSPAATASPSGTVSGSATVSPSRTSSASVSPSRSPSISITPSLSKTSSLSLSRTLSPSLSSSSSRTPSASMSRTVSASVSRSPSSSLSASPSLSRSISPSGTSSVSSSSSSSATRSRSATSSPSFAVSPSSSSSLSRSASSSSSPSPTRTASASVSPSPSMSSSASSSPSRSATSTVSPSSAASLSSTTSMSSSPSPSTSATTSRTATATLSTTASPSASATPSTTATSSISSSSSPSRTVSGTASVSPSLSPSASSSSSRSPSSSGSATRSPSPSVSPSPSPMVLAAATSVSLLLNSTFTFTGSSSLDVATPMSSVRKTFTTCVKLPSTTTGYLFASTKTPSLDSRCFSLYVSSGSYIQLYYGEDTGSRQGAFIFDGSRSIASSTYRRFTLVVTETSVTAYMDGNQFGNSVTLGSQVPNFCQFNTVGKRFPSTGFLTGGELSQLAIYHYAMDQDQISNLQSCSSSPPSVYPFVVSSLSFSGANSSDVSVPTSIGAAKTLSMCTSLPSGTTGYLIASGKTTTTDTRCFSLYVASATSLQLYYGEDTGSRVIALFTDSSKTLTTNSLQRIAVVVTATNVTAYLNGNQFGSVATLTTQIPTFCTYTTVGKRFPATGFLSSGSIVTSAWVYNQALSAAQVGTLYGCASPSVNLVSSSLTFNGATSFPLLSAPMSVQKTWTTCINLPSTATGYLFASSTSSGVDKRCFSLFVQSASIVQFYYGEHSGSRVLFFNSDPANPFSTSTWNRFSIVVTSTNITMYVNGNQFGNVSTITTSLPTFCGYNVAGARPVSTGLLTAGQMSSLTVYSSALSASAIAALPACAAKSADPSLDSENAEAPHEMYSAQDVSQLNPGPSSIEF